jgi:hypothetical protein
MMGKLFGGILGSLMSEEYLKQEGIVKDPEPTTEEVEAPASAPTVATKASHKAASYPTVAPSIVTPSMGNEKTEIREKLYQAVVKLNKEGIDFFELWDNTLEMDGGANAANIRNAYKLLNKMSGGTLTPQVINDTCNYYTTNIQSIMDKSIGALEAEKQRLSDSMATEQENLTKQIADLKKQIADLIQVKATAETDLAQIDSKYSPEIQAIDRKVANGKTESAAFIGEMNNFLSTVQTAIQ